MKHYRIIPFKTFYTLLFIISFTLSGMAQDNHQRPERAIAFLGVFHFAGTNDMVSMKINDLKSEQRQQEIMKLVDELAKMNPDKVILEYPYGNIKLDSLYQAYLNGVHQLSFNERQQVGFRLAKKLGHPHIYVADHPMDIAFEPLMKYLQEEQQLYKLDTLVANAQAHMKKWEGIYNQGTLSDLLAVMNTRDADNENKNIYLQEFNVMGGAENTSGVTVVSKWWERNFRIMKNIDLLMNPGEKALVIFGQGHTAILKDLYHGRTDVEVIDVMPYLEVTGNK